jgi:RNA polymerase sigma factor (sigma-70 family)
MRTVDAVPNEADPLCRVYERFRRPLLSFFRRRSSEEAEDLTQEVFLRLAASTDIRRVERPDAYIFQTAANLLKDRHRRLSARAADTYLSIDILAATQQCPASLVDLLDPERIALGRADAAQVAARLSALPKRTRDIFILYRLEGMRQRDIAAALGLSLSCIEKHLVKAMASLCEDRDVT